MILRSISVSLGGTLSNKIGDIKNTAISLMNGFNNSDLEQNVHIDATFPNVNSKQEIEDAFNDLVNLAAQRAMKR